MDAQTTKLNKKLENQGYISNSELTMSLNLMDQLERPLLIEGEAGVGKTAIANTLAKVNDCNLIRLQCYEGLDAQSAVYEWNYSKQLLWVNLQKENRNNENWNIEHIFNKDFLLERPLLQAISQTKPPILLIDEIDRADEAFEAFLLELLSEYQISIPEYGTVKALSIPRVILTSNGTRELSDALRRRCLYHYMDYPGKARESLIIEKSLPDINKQLNLQIINFIQALRKQDLRKKPGIAETIDWSAALLGMGVVNLLESAEILPETLGCLLKTKEDVDAIDRHTLQTILNTAA